jgi:alpha-ketoglutarate-dependent 2,4-dichlorophenoxyacetate dioxygenase
VQTETDSPPKSLEIVPLGGSFAAEVRGVDIATDLTPDVLEQIDDALAEYGVLVFRDQPISDDDQQRLIEHFGEPVKPVLDAVKRSGDRNPHFFDVATVDEDGKPLEPDSARALYFAANRLWHTDGSQAQPPIRVTALSAQVLPSTPPPTEYANMRAAWNDLPDARKDAIDAMMVEHDILFSRAKLGPLSPEFVEDSRKKRPPAHHPLVRSHVRNSKKSLYLASHASHVIGMPVDDGRALIEELTEFATQPKYVYAHQWRPFDLVLWDDSWTMHRSTEYNGTEPRIMRWGGALERAPV